MCPRLHASMNAPAIPLTTLWSLSRSWCWRLNEGKAGYTTQSKTFSPFPRNRIHIIIPQDKKTWCGYFMVRKYGIWGSFHSHGNRSLLLILSLFLLPGRILMYGISPRCENLVAWKWKIYVQKHEEVTKSCLWPVTMLQILHYVKICNTEGFKIIPFYIERNYCFMFVCILLSVRILMYSDHSDMH